MRLYFVLLVLVLGPPVLVLGLHVLVLVPALAPRLLYLYLYLYLDFMYWYWYLHLHLTSCTCTWTCTWTSCTGTGTCTCTSPLVLVLVLDDIVLATRLNNPNFNTGMLSQFSKVSSCDIFPSAILFLKVEHIGFVSILSLNVLWTSLL